MTTTTTTTPTTYRDCIRLALDSDRIDAEVWYSVVAYGSHPDSKASVGGRWIDRLADDVRELARDYIDDNNSDDPGARAYVDEYADDDTRERAASAVPIYTRKRIKVWADLMPVGASEEIGTAPGSIFEIMGLDLYIVASAAIRAGLTEVRNLADELADEYGIDY